MKKMSDKGIKYKTGIPYSTGKRTAEDAEYLCKKGSKSACEVLEVYLRKKSSLKL